MDVKIIEKESFEIVVQVRTFDAANSNEEIPKFWGAYFESGTDKLVTPVLGACINEENNHHTFTYGIGDFSVNVKQIPNDFEVFTIPTYTWTIFNCVGPMPDAIQNTWTKIMTDWLPNSNYEAIQTYDLEYYTCGNTQSVDYVSEIWLPIKHK